MESGARGGTHEWAETEVEKNGGWAELRGWVRAKKEEQKARERREREVLEAIARHERTLKEKGGLRNVRSARNLLKQTMNTAHLLGSTGQQRENGGEDVMRATQWTMRYRLSSSLEGIKVISSLANTHLHHRAASVLQAAARQVLCVRVFLREHVRTLQILISCDIMKY